MSALLLALSIVIRDTATPISCKFGYESRGRFECLDSRVRWLRPVYQNGYFDRDPKRPTRYGRVRRWVLVEIGELEGDGPVAFTLPWNCRPLRTVANADASIIVRTDGNVFVDVKKANGAQFYFEAAQ